MSTLLERLRTKVTERTESAKIGYREMVQRIADGEDFSDEQAERILDATGLTIDDVERDAERYRRRKAQREAYDAGQAAEAERRTIQAAEKDLTTKMNAEIEAATAKIKAVYEPKLADLHTREKAADQAIRVGESAIESLVRSAPDELTDRLPGYRQQLVLQLYFCKTPAYS